MTCVCSTSHADVNECESEGVCDTNAQCNNTYGSFMCECNPGFTGDGFECQGKAITGYLAALNEVELTQ